jgi:para-aminobenzoate synthetase component I
MSELPLSLHEHIAGSEAFSRPLDCVHVLDLSYCDPSELISRWLELEGALGLMSDGGSYGRYSYLACAPDAILNLGFTDSTDAREMLRAATACLGRMVRTDLPPFSGGVVGLAGFELGARLEGLAREAFRLNAGAPWPELTLLRYPAVLAFDHHNRTLTAIGRGETSAVAATSCEALVQVLQTLPEDRHQTLQPLSDQLNKETPDDVYEGRISDLIDQIHAGDLFQANLSRGFSGVLRHGVTPGQVMQAIARAGPAPFGAFLRLGHQCILSNSPERFISLSAEGALETRPIKGTRPRGATPEADAELARALLRSEKDRAENLMIVDLMRHDLSRVAVPGSVKVTALNALESYTNVHHLVSTVTARLRPDKTVADVIADTFPPGSISGAPKVQAMKVIARMEAPRGPYCGSLFFASADGGMDSNVLIRTLALQADANGDWHYRLCAGGGIVADSQAADERAESDTKLSLLRAVLTGKKTDDR